MDYENIAKQILQHIGGKENVATVIHCMTRLRFTLKNEAIANDEAVKNTKGVVGVMKKAGQYQIIIGNDVLLASRIYIGGAQHGNYKGKCQDSPFTPPNERTVIKNDLKIGNNVWIGNGCSILGSLGEGCIIGAGSVVTHDIPEYSIAVGNPAKVIKQYDSEKGEWREC